MSENQVSKRIHPLVAGAAASVILVSLVGVAAMTGMLPNSNSTPKVDNQSGATSASNAVATATPVSASGTADNNARSTLAPVNLPTPDQHLAQSNGAPANTANSSNLSQNGVNTAPMQQKICETCGVVESVRAVEQQAAHGSGLGAVAGAVLGGVLGHQVGNGNGRSLATVAGAVGGGFAGNAIEKREHTTTVYEVRVKMDNGHVRTFKPSVQPEYREGDRVHIANGSVIIG